MKPIVHRSDCPMSYSLDFFGDKWTPLVFRDIMFYDKTSYLEFLGSSEKIASNILTDRLNVLHNEGFLIKSVSPTNKSKFIYGLTDKGIALVPLMVELLIWGAEFNPDGGPQAVLDKIKRNKNIFIKELQEKLTARRKSLDQSSILKTRT